jgi:hypothetical protein
LAADRCGFEMVIGSNLFQKKKEKNGDSMFGGKNIYLFFMT